MIKYSMSNFHLKKSMIFFWGGGWFFNGKPIHGKVWETLVYSNSNCTSNEQQQRRFYYPNNAQCTAQSQFIATQYPEFPIQPTSSLLCSKRRIFKSISSR